jgi:hypothetical protein
MGKWVADELAYLQDPMHAMHIKMLYQMLGLPIHKQRTTRSQFQPRANWAIQLQWLESHRAYD